MFCSIVKIYKYNVQNKVDNGILPYLNYKWGFWIYIYVRNEINSPIIKNKSKFFLNYKKKKVQEQARERLFWVRPELIRKKSVC